MSIETNSSVYQSTGNDLFLILQTLMKRLSVMPSLFASLKNILKSALEC